jgi:predicted ferric reductase
VRRHLVAQAIFWIVVYTVLAIAPLVLLKVGQVPPGREFWRELSVALGFAGLAMLTLQFVLTARFRSIKAPYGADVVYHFHRQISLVSVVLISAHPLLLFVNAPETISLLNLVTSPWRARMGVMAVLLLLVLIAASLWRRRWKIDYSAWRVWHGILATLIVVLAMGHVVLARHYLNQPWKQALWIGYGGFWVGLLLYVRLVKPLLLLRKPYNVESVRPERGGAWTVALRPLGHAGIAFMPGQFAWLTVGQSPFVEAEHPFSYSSSAGQTDHPAFTVKALGDFTRTIPDLKPGTPVYVDGPFGHFSVDRQPHAEEYVFVAGGVGITPIMSMLRTLAERGESRPLLLFYANRDWESVTFREELEGLKTKLNLEIVHVLEKPHDGWTGEQGYLTQAVLERHLPREWNRNAIEVFVCGPPPMMAAVERALLHMGVPLGDIHSERFNLV